MAVNSYNPSAPPYPISVPPQHRPRTTGPNNPQTVRQRPSCCCVLSVVAFICVVVWLTYFWMIENPVLPEFRVESATLSYLNTTSDSTLTATWDINFVATNPNRRYKIYYDYVEGAVRYRYGDITVKLGGDRQLLPFSLKQRSDDTRVNFRVDVVREWYGDVVAQQISYDRSCGLVSFIVRIEASVKFKAWLIPGIRHSLQLNCDNVEFGFSKNDGTGVLTSHSGDCSVDQIVYA